MNEVLEVLYHRWAETECNEGEEVLKIMSEYRQALEQTRLERKALVKLDDAVSGMNTAYERQGFTAGFETARQLLTGQHLSDVLTGKGA